MIIGDASQNYWKVEAMEHGFTKAGMIDHLKPDPSLGIFLMEQRGEL